MRQHGWWLRQQLDGKVAGSVKKVRKKWELHFSGAGAARLQ
jgi:hypothetical protein